MSESQGEGKGAVPPGSWQEVRERYREEELLTFVDREIPRVETPGRDGDTLLHVACVRGFLEEVLPLLAAGAPVNLPGEMGYTPLHHAVSQGHREVARLLLARGADPDLRNGFGRSAREMLRLQGWGDLLDERVGEG